MANRLDMSTANNILAASSVVLQLVTAFVVATAFIVAAVLGIALVSIAVATFVVAAALWFHPHMQLL